jgi:hypothetical protein
MRNSGRWIHIMPWCLREFSVMDQRIVVSTATISSVGRFTIIKARSSHHHLEGYFVRLLKDPQGLICRFHLTFQRCCYVVSSKLSGVGWVEELVVYGKRVCRRQDSQSSRSRCVAVREMLSKSWGGLGRQAPAL